MVQLLPAGRPGCGTAASAGEQRAMRAISSSALRIRSSFAFRASLALRKADRSIGAGQNVDGSWEESRLDERPSGKLMPQAGSNRRPPAVRQRAKSPHSPALTPRIIRKTQIRIDRNARKIMGYPL
jgi:hypothetical protein